MTARRSKAAHTTLASNNSGRESLNATYAHGDNPPGPEEAAEGPNFWGAFFVCTLMVVLSLERPDWRR
jgi:hypothetical protein